ncbi:family UPF0160 protein [Gregarina niphandrodes]|uniref:Family UPF0160 protein n=1 Tax=Gregarina niphandrodes TaxID=110365 RepID=A0A023BBA6_GRENI|nr:family UPF0160 protein [Gregarina niphandrodes]EZG79347.1 family UPF0160 protein [Gregarina niphandrodes]|eukprot:XP_011129067.1 family UPF0160 protein [Gregarina niphandrodes]
MVEKVYSFKQVTEEVLESLVGCHKIGTHSGTHHLDEVCSVVLLTLLPRFASSVVIRHRDDAILDKCDIVVDVGGIYDPVKNRFDHHQKEFGEYWSETQTATRLSSAGLVWKHFGKEVLVQLLGDAKSVDAKSVDESKLGQLQQVTYDLVFESVDAGDNGVRSCTCTPDRIKYTGSLPGLAGLVGSFNASWIEAHNESEGFKNACAEAQQHLLPIITQIASQWFAALDHFSQAERLLLGGDKCVLLLTKYVRFSKFLPYMKPHLKNSAPVVGCVWEEFGVWCYSYTPEPWKVVHHSEGSRPCKTRDQAVEDLKNLTLHNKCGAALLSKDAPPPSDCPS